MRKFSRIAAGAGVLALAAGALLIPAAVSATSGFSGPGFTPVLIPSSESVKCASGAKFGVSLAPVRIGIHRVGPGHLGNSTNIVVYGIGPHPWKLTPANHWHVTIPAGSKVPCNRKANKGVWVPNAPHSQTATKYLHFTKCASPHC